jgi:hypothetical protein
VDWKKDEDQLVNEDRERSVLIETNYGSADSIGHPTLYFPKFLLVESCWLGKITTDPRFLVHVNMDSAYERYPELKIYNRTDCRYILTHVSYTCNNVLLYFILI